MKAPRRSMSSKFWRIFRYAKIRTVRVAGSPHAVAAGLTAGFVVAWTPFPGVHLLMGLALAWLVRGSLVAAAIGTTFSNPLTIPFILPLTWEVGHVILGRDASGPAPITEVLRSLESFHVLELWKPVLQPMLLGSLPLMIVTGPCCYLIAFLAVRRYRAARRERLALR